MAIGTEFFGTDVASFALGADEVIKMDLGSTTVYESAVDNALDLFRAGVATADVFVVGEWQPSSGGSGDNTRVQLGIGATFAPVAQDGTEPLANITAWNSATNGAGTSGEFLTMRTPVGSFVLLWVDDQNFALYEVDSHLQGLDFIDVVSLEMMVSVGVTGAVGPTGVGGTLYVFTDTAAFLASVIEINGVWRPRPAGEVPISATITYNTTTSRYEALATGGTGTLNYAWTFEVDGIRFRLDPVDADGETTYLAPNALTNAQRMTFGLVPANKDATVDFDVRPAYNPTTLFPGHTVSNIGLTMSDDTHDEFFPIADTSNIAVPPTALRWLYLDNWRNASGLSDSVSVSGTPIGTTVANWAYGHATDDISLLSADFAGTVAEYAPYAINGIGHNTGGISPVTTRLGTITLASAPSLTMNAIALFQLDVLSLGSFTGTSEIDIAIPQTT